MPKLIVDTTEHVEEYPEAKSYFIDEQETLHIVGTSGNIAAFARGVWQYVTTA